MNAVIGYLAGFTCAYLVAGVLIAFSLVPDDLPPWERFAGRVTFTLIWPLLFITRI